MEQEAITNEAREISSWIGEAVSEIAYGAVKYPDPDNQKTFKKAKKSGVTDMAGWYADELYNDVDTLQDLTGDRIYDAAQGKTLKERYENMILIAEAINDGSHPALVKALTSHIERWKQFAKKLNK